MMKPLASLMVALISVATLFACTPDVEQTTGTSSPSSSSASTPTTSTSSPDPAMSATSESASNVELFTMDELFNQGGGGCGMTLWKQEDGLRPPGYLFFNQLAQQSGNGFTLMKIDGEFVRFRRITATGEEFYGQQTSQTFVSQDDVTQLQVDVTLGQPGESESVAVEGTLKVEQNGQMIEIPVRGDAGC